MLCVPPEKGEAFWTESALTAFVGIASLIAAKPERPFSLGELYRTITMPGTKAFFAKDDGDGALSEGCRPALRDFTSSADNPFPGIIKPVTSKTTLGIHPTLD